jgi:hypothetical protein
MSTVDGGDSINLLKTSLTGCGRSMGEMGARWRKDTRGLCYALRRLLQASKWRDEGIVWSGAVKRLDIAIYNSKNIVFAVSKHYNEWPSLADNPLRYCCRLPFDLAENQVLT